MTLYIDEKNLEDIDDFDAIIDVRSPREFHEDHIIGSVNLPVLKNSEYEKVGTIYQNISPFEAKKVGARLVSLNISSHLETFFHNKKKIIPALILLCQGRPKVKFVRNYLCIYRMEMLHSGWRV